METSNLLILSWHNWYDIITLVICEPSSTFQILKNADETSILTEMSLKTFQPEMDRPNLANTRGWCLTASFTRCQFHQCSMSGFCASRFTLLLKLFILRLINDTLFMKYYQLKITIFRHDSTKYGSTCSPKSFFAYPIKKDLFTDLIGAHCRADSIKVGHYFKFSVLVKLCVVLLVK